MRRLYFLLPGTSGRFVCGGLWAELKTLKMAQQICTADVVTYRQREPNTLFLADVLQQANSKDAIFVVSWGFDVAKLVAQLQGYHVVYHAHSAGYGLRLPANIPIITVSRNTLGYWGQQAPHAPIYYLPNQISDEFYNYHQPRDLDVLVQARKSSEYLMQGLIPALQSRCRVQIVDGFVEDLAGLFNRANVYLYDSAEYWAMQGVSEGFGLQPLEAIACGCKVFSSVNGGLSDYLDPGFNCHKIAVYSQDYDAQRILTAIHAPSGFPEFQLDEYRSNNILHRLQVILSDINQFFDYHHATVIPKLTALHLTQLRGKQLIGKIKKRYFSKL